MSIQKRIENLEAAAKRKPAPEMRADYSRLQPSEMKELLDLSDAAGVVGEGGPWNLQALTDGQLERLRELYHMVVVPVGTDPNTLSEVH